MIFLLDKMPIAGRYNFHKNKVFVFGMVKLRKIPCEGKFLGAIFVFVDFRTENAEDADFFWGG